jgi:hypothetical protein
MPCCAASVSPYCRECSCSNFIYGCNEIHAPSKGLRCGSWALVVSSTFCSVPLSDVVWQSGMAAQAEQLQGCLARVGSFLEHAEAALSRLSLLPAMLKTTPMSGPAEVSVGSLEDRGAELYGSFYPRVGENRCCCPPCLAIHLPLRASLSPQSWLWCYRPCPSFRSFVRPLIWLCLWSM